MKLSRIVTVIPKEAQLKSKGEEKPKLRVADNACFTDSDDRHQHMKTD